MQMLSDYLDDEHLSVPSNCDPLLNARYAVLKTVANNSRDIVALFADGYESELESLLENADGLSYLEFDGPIEVRR